MSQQDARPREPGPLRLGKAEFAPGRGLVMAIVNRTPDSFYRPGLTWDEQAAIDRVHQVVAGDQAGTGHGGLDQGRQDAVAAGPRAGVAGWRRQRERPHIVARATDGPAVAESWTSTGRRLAGLAALRAGRRRTRWLR